MGFFSDFGKGMASMIEAPFKGVADVIQGVGNGIGAILHGSSNCDQSAQGYCGQCANQWQGFDPTGATKMLQFQNALMTNMLLRRALYPANVCGV